MIATAAIILGYLAIVVAFWPWGLLLVAGHAAMMLAGMWRK